MTDVGKYYQRLLSWYQLGGFTDEYGVMHKSGYYFNLTYWEVLNEVNYEHSMSPQFYTQIYDAISTAINAVLPDIKFVGCALAQGFNVEAWFGYFLNISNHVPKAVMPEYVSFHFYASCNDRNIPTEYESFFTEVDSGLVPCVESFFTVKSQQSSNVKLDLDEIGVILPNDNSYDPEAFPLIYWNAAGAMYAYIFGLMS